MTTVSASDASTLKPWECSKVYHDLKTGKEGIYGKQSEKKTSNRHTSDLYVGNQTQSTSTSMFRKNTF